MKLEKGGQMSNKKHLPTYTELSAMKYMLQNQKNDKFSPIKKYQVILFSFYVYMTVLTYFS